MTTNTFNALQPNLAQRMLAILGNALGALLIQAQLHLMVYGIK